MAAPTMVKWADYELQARMDSARDNGPRLVKPREQTEYDHYCRQYAVNPHRTAERVDTEAEKRLWLWGKDLEVYMIDMAMAEARRLRGEK
jgi:hypothetical protein